MWKMLSASSTVCVCGGGWVFKHTHLKDRGNVEDEEELRIVFLKHSFFYLSLSIYLAIVLFCYDFNLTSQRLKDLVG